MAKNRYRVITTEKTTKHFEVEANNPAGAAFAVATGLLSDPPLEPIKVETNHVGTQTALVGGKADTLEVPAG